MVYSDLGVASRNRYHWLRGSEVIRLTHAFACCHLLIMDSFLVKSIESRATFSLLGSSGASIIGGELVSLVDMHTALNAILLENHASLAVSGVDVDVLVSFLCGIA